MASPSPRPARRGSRRSPSPEERQRDAERTRNRLLDAALVEFAAKGFGGARVNEIAARAGVNKQLISYYFGGKEGLYEALSARWFREEDEMAPPDLSLEDLVVRYLEGSVHRRDMYRLFVRHGLDYVPSRRRARTTKDGEDHAEVADLRRRQEAGELADDLDPAYVLLVFMGAVNAGITMPQRVAEVTGLDPASPEFVERYGEQLRRIIRRLR